MIFAGKLVWKCRFYCCSLLTSRLCCLNLRPTGPPIGVLQTVGTALGDAGSIGITSDQTGTARTSGHFVLPSLHWPRSSLCSAVMPLFSPRVVVGFFGVVFGVPRRPACGGSARLLCLRVVLRSQSSDRQEDRLAHTRPSARLLGTWGGWNHLQADRTARAQTSTTAFPLSWTQPSRLRFPH